MAAGPRSTSAFLVVTALLFAVLLVVISWRSGVAGAAMWLFATGVVVAAVAVVLGVVFARGVGEGRL